MNGENNELDIKTRLVHTGMATEPPTGRPVSTPIYATSTFTYDSMSEADEVFGGSKPGYIYTRHGNPTVQALEEAVRELEGGASACAYASGMAALHAALLACDLSPGAKVIASQDLYGATLNLLNTIFGAFGVQTIIADFSDVATLRERARELRPSVFVAETISNPLLKVCDIEACAEVAHSVGARLVVDNTFASPYLSQPLRHGADFAVHSATKYLGGHSDATGGIVVAREATDAPALVGAMKLAGGILGMWEAHAILRGIKTLAIRMERQCANASHLAEHLSTHARIARVYYPARSSSEQNEIMRRMLRAPFAGALVTLELRDNTRASAFRFMDALRVCLRSTSLGDVFTSVLHPPTASHRDMPPSRRSALGITDGVVRVSVGIEDIKDIIADIDQALEAS